MLSKFDRASVWANQVVVGGLMLVMTVLVFANVGLRYLAGFSLPWVEELTRYMMIWVAYLGAGLALRAGSHVAVEIMQDMMPVAMTRRLRIVIAVVVLMFLVTVAWYGFQYAQFTMRQVSPVLNIPLGIVYLGVPLGCLLCAVHLVLGFRRYVDRDFHSSEIAPESPNEALTLSAVERQQA
ncbi:hypothetical protein ATN84_18265 [Paramesorhizobium deserti]|uniref:TRAP transporter small permease protein n=1 Tax=Paramesorhizobium deserti TaxID=1494590 RepID=A0A135HRR9_9HYPH|nr:TRAP transporter small permease [Paramesorhizobium deserti]KXF75899.1 hypothetical protein ATN84_18265 [Paramesorhizobium deserti]